MTPVTAVVFDLGGVLIDWDPRHMYRKIFGPDEAAMERFLAEVCTQDWNARQDGGRSFADGAAELLAAFPERAELITAYRARWIEMLGGAFEGTVEILLELRRAGLRTYALSNWSAETFPLARPLFPFLDGMDGILLSGEVKLSKPDPAIFRLFLERFGLAPEATVYIDDHRPNIETATALGLKALLFTDADQLRTDLRRLGLVLEATSQGKDR
jgi:2-haloacid dehalogenase